MLLAMPYLRMRLSRFCPVGTVLPSVSKALPPWFGIRDTYVSTVDNVVPVVACSSVYSLVEDDDNWKSGDISLSRNADVRACLRVDLTAIQTRFHVLRFAVPDKGGELFGLALGGLDVLQKLGEARTWVAALEASRAGRLARIEALQSYQREPLHKNRYLAHQLVTVRDEEERHEARDVESTKAVTDAKVERLNAKEALHVLEGRASTDSSTKRGAMEDRDHVQGELVTTSARLQVGKWALTATFDHLKPLFSKVRPAEAAV